MGLLTESMLKVVEKEQNDGRSEKILSGILWDMFTGNERYKKVFAKSIKIRMHIDMCEGLLQERDREVTMRGRGTRQDLCER